MHTQAVLTCKRGGKSSNKKKPMTGRARRDLNRNLKRAITDHFASMKEKTNDAKKKNDDEKDQGRPRRRPGREDEHRRTIDKLNNLLSQGKVSKACRVLNQTNQLADLTNPDNMNLMMRLHPKRRHQLPLPEPPPSDDLVAISLKQKRELVKNVHNGSGAGPSGMTPD